MGHKRSEVHFLKPDSLLPIHADCERRCGMLARADDALTALNYFAFAGEFYAPCFRVSNLTGNASFHDHTRLRSVGSRLEAAFRGDTLELGKTVLIRRELYHAHSTRMRSA